MTLPSISEAQRRPEKDLWRELELARPRLLGALLEAASHGLRMLSGVRFDRLPRIADFALWAAACETALWPVDTFARAYERNRRTAIEGAIVVCQATKSAEPLRPVEDALIALYALKLPTTESESGSDPTP